MKRRLLAMFLTITMVLAGVVASPVQVQANPTVTASISSTGVLSWNITGAAGTVDLWILIQGATAPWSSNAAFGSVDLVAHFNHMLASGHNNITLVVSYQGGTPSSHFMSFNHVSTQLSTPVGLSVDSNNIFRWNVVSGAERYWISVRAGGSEIFSSSSWTNSFDLRPYMHLLTPGQTVQLDVFASAPLNTGITSSSRATINWVVSGAGIGNQPTVNFTISPHGSGWATYSPTWNQSTGRWDVRITAHPHSGFEFHYWRGVDGNEWSRHNPTSASMLSGQSWSPTAVFRHIGHHNVTISPSSNFSLNIWQTRQLHATTVPHGAFVTWTSSNHSVATVTSYGMVMAVGHGSATITATTSWGSASVVVSVGTGTTWPGTANWVSVSSPGSTITQGGNMQFSASVSPTGVSQAVDWSITPTISGVSVNNNGLVTVGQNVPVGTNITVRAVARGTGVSGTRSVTVTAAGQAGQQGGGQGQQGGQGQVTTPSATTTLASPGGLNMQGNVLHWTAVPNARGYVIYVGGVVRSAPTVATHFSLSALGLPAGHYNVQVRAVGDGTATIDSPLSTGISFTSTRVETPAATPAPTPAPATGEQPSQWAHWYVNAAIDAGLVPQNLRSQYTQPTTRAEFATLAVALYENIMRYEIRGRVQFNDTSDINVQKMAYLGVVLGDGHGNFAPNETLTREQAATMLTRLAYVMGQPLPASTATFDDYANISPWARDAAGRVQAAGVMNGSGGNFSPQGPYTREQSIATFVRMFNFILS